MTGKSHSKAHHTVPTVKTDPFPNGVSSGDVTQTSAVLWVHAVHTGKVKFQIATDPSFHHIVDSETVKVTNPLAPVKAEFDGLKADQQYYYRAIDADGHVIEGSFETAAKLGKHEGLEFAVMGDLHGRLAPYVAIKNAVDFDLDFVLKFGDTATADLPTGVTGISQVNDGKLQTFQSIYNDSYSSHFGVNFLADLQAKTPILAVPDDHEVLDDYAGGARPSEDLRIPSRHGDDFINETAFYKTAMKAFGQYDAIEDRVYHGTGEDRFDGAPDFYRYNTYGSDAAVIVLDGRSFRDAELAHLADVPLPFPNIQFLADSFEPGRTLLGDIQLERLKQDLLDARDNGVTWKFIMLPEAIQEFGPVIRPGDRYEGYQAERTQLLKFIDQNHIENVVFVTADTHWFSVNNLTYQEHFGGPQIATSIIDINAISPGDMGFAPVIPSFAAQLGVISPAALAFYNSLPVAPDMDSFLNDKDDFVKALFHDTLVALGYDPIGLNDNIAAAAGKIHATLLQGDYFLGHSIGWTDFNIDAATQKLMVTVWGIDPYTAEQIADPALTASILAREPAILSQFELAPTSNSIIGSARGDRVDGTNGADVILGAAGNDQLKGGNGDDYLDGGKDDDTLYGGNGNDVLYGRDGKDTLKGEGGNDRLEGGAGKDSVSGGDGDDIFIATVGDDNDSYDGGAGTDRLDLSATKAAATVDLGRGTASSDDIGKDSLSSVENVVGGSGADRITGDDGSNRLEGGAGADKIDGGRGNDTIIGGADNDTLTGGSGNDTFVFAAGFGRDTITDFSAGPSVGDVIQFDHTVFADFAAVLAATTDLGSDLKISATPNDWIVLKDISSISHLHANDFSFV